MPNHQTTTHRPAASPPDDRWARITGSPGVREQQVAFTCATGVPLTLLPASRNLDAAIDDAYCVQGCLGEPSGDLCRRKLLRAEGRALRQSGPIQYCCPSGLVKILVPVFLDDVHLGSLLAGPFTLHSLDEQRLTDLVERLDKAGLGDRVGELRTTWQFSPLLTSRKCRAAATLLDMFARYLAGVGRRLERPTPSGTSTLLDHIEAFLASTQDGPVTLREVAASVNLSPCHFCSVFKKQTGLTFTAYRNRRRLDRAEALLRQPGRRISDVAFEAGFESIPYFNRAFRRRFGCSPSDYRRRFAAEIRDKKSAIAA